MKGIFFILVISCILACSSARNIKKELSTMDMLIKKSWYLRTGTTSKTIIKDKYSKRTIKCLFWLKEKEHGVKNYGSAMYYLSDSIERSFKPSQVGQKEFGKYIINERGSVIEILKLNIDTLITQAVRLDSAIYIGVGPLLYTTTPPQ